MPDLFLPSSASAAGPGSNPPGAGGAIGQQASSTGGTYVDDTIVSSPVTQDHNTLHDNPIIFSQLF